MLSITQEQKSTKTILKEFCGGLRRDSDGVSMAVGVACLLALEHANGLEVDDRENIDLDRRIENDYIGLRNGILDQTAIIWSRRNRLTLIDCKGGRHRRVPKDAEVDVDAHPIAGCAWVLAYSGVEAPLQASSLFNDRVQQCQDLRPLAKRRIPDDVGAPHQ